MKLNVRQNGPPPNVGQSVGSMQPGQASGPPLMQNVTPPDVGRANPPAQFVKQNPGTPAPMPASRPEIGFKSMQNTPNTNPPSFAPGPMGPPPMGPQGPRPMGPPPSGMGGPPSYGPGGPPPYGPGGPPSNRLSQPLSRPSMNGLAPPSAPEFGGLGSKSNSNRVLIIAGAIFCLLLIVGGVAYYWIGKQTPDVTLYQLQTMSANQDIGGGGLIYAQSAYAISFPLAERVTGLHVKPGDVVKQGDKLIDLDPTQLNATILQAQASVTAAQQRLQLAQSYGTVSTISAAQADLTNAQANLQTLTSQTTNQFIKDSALIAQSSGVVTEVDITSGQVFSPGITLMVVQNEDALVVHAKIPIAYFGHLTVGQAALVQPSSISNLSVPGKIVQIVPLTDPQTDTFEVWVQFDNIKITQKLTPGMSAFVRVQTATQKADVVIPRVAVANSDTTHASVFVVGSDGKAHQQAVHVDGHTEHAVFVDSGVKPGDKVVIVGAYQLQDNQPVHVDQVETQQATL